VSILQFLLHPSVMKIDSSPPNISVLLALWLLWLCTYCHAQLLPQPRFLWSINLDDTNKSHSLKKGNGVVASQDGDHIFATASNGSLHIVSRSNLSPLETIIFRPPTATGTSECSSKPVLVFDGTSNAYAIYSVVNGNESTIFGVSFDGKLKWQVMVDGQIMGTPAVSSNAIYVSHNVDATTGYLSVLLFDSENQNDHTDAPVLTATLAPTEGNAPLGPPSLDLENTLQDVVAVAESWDQGYASQGNLYLLVFSEEYDQFNGRGNESYRMQHVSSWPFSASARPLVVSSSVWLGASGALIGGWQQKDVFKLLTGQRENINPKWTLQFDTKTGDAGQPFLTAPVISDDESMLVLAGTNGELYGLQSKDGKQQWASMNGGTAILAQPVIVEDVLYVIESQNGTVRQHSLFGGDEIWQLDCDSDSLICEEAVEADFTISPNGALLYYGDVSGNIVALQIGTVDTPAPTMVPTTLPPTRNPSSTIAPTKTAQDSLTDGANHNGQDNDVLDTSEDNVANLAGNETGNGDSGSAILMIGSAVGAFFVVVATIALFVLCRKRRNRKKNAGHKSASSDFVYQKTLYSQSSNRELDYGTPDKTTPVAPPKTNAPDTFTFDSDSEVGTANNQHLPSSNDSTRDLTDTFSLVAPSETDDGTLTNKDGMPSDASHMSEESNLPIPPPPTGPIPKQVQTESNSMLEMEEKKDDEATRADSISYANMYADNSVDDLQLQSQAPVSPTSTVSESSVYTGQPSNSASPENSFTNLKSTSSSNVPVLPDVFDTFMNRDAVPDDEEDVESSRERLILSQSTKQPAYKLKHASGVDDESIPNDERTNAGPGAHYMSKAPRDKNLYNTVAMRRDNSIDGNGAKFGASRQMAPSLGIGQEEPDPIEQNTEKWSSFMSELEEAEKMFSEPNLKSSRLLSDDESTDAGSSFMGLINNPMGSMLGSNRGI